MAGDITKQLGEQLCGCKFDVALLIHVIEHIDNVDSFLRSLLTIFTTLVIEVPDFEADVLNQARHMLGCSYYSDPDHVREYTIGILRQQLNRNGWSVLGYEKHGGDILMIAVRNKKST